MKAQLRNAALARLAERYKDAGEDHPVFASFEALESHLRASLSRVRCNAALARAFWREAQHGGFW